jgi:hypothetical protein
MYLSGNEIFEIANKLGSMKISFVDRESNTLSMKEMFINYLYDDGDYFLLELEDIKNAFTIQKTDEEFVFYDEDFTIKFPKTIES